MPEAIQRKRAGESRSHPPVWTVALLAAISSVTRSPHVSTQVNPVFHNLTDVLKKIENSEATGVLTALAESLRGQGERFGQGMTGGNGTLKEINPRADTVRRDFQALKGFSDA